LKPSWLSTRVACGCAAHSSSPRVDCHALARENCVLLSMTPADLVHRMCCGPVVTTCSVCRGAVSMPLGPGAAAHCVTVFDPMGLQGRNSFWIHTLFPPRAQARTHSLSDSPKPQAQAGPCAMRGRRGGRSARRHRSATYLTTLEASRSPRAYVVLDSTQRARSPPEA